MPTFIYTGASSATTISGTHVERGIPTELVGAAAEAAGDHPDFEEAGDAPSPLASYAEIKARARELGIPAIGKAADLAEAIAVEEARLDAAAAAD